jgi:DNA-binding beta-propeller fold protein YncE
MNFGAPTPVEINVSGPDLGADRSFAEKLRIETAKIRALRDLQYDEPLDYPSIEVNLDREREMMQIRPLVSFLAVYVLVGVFAEGQTLRKVAAIDLPGPGGKRFDYLTIDTDDNYLISAHLWADQTYVIDLATNRVVATIADTPGAEGVEYVPEIKKFYTSNAHDNTIGVVDLKQMKVIKKLKTESKPDGGLPFTRSTFPTSEGKRKPSST